MRQRTGRPARHAGHARRPHGGHKGRPETPSAGPCAVFSDERGNVYDSPEHGLLTFDGARVRAPEPHELIPLPPGSDIFRLPGRAPLGAGAPDGRPTPFGPSGVEAAAAFIAPAYLRLLHPAVRVRPGAPALPTFAYSALGFTPAGFVTAAVRVDPERRQDPPLFDLPTIRRAVERQGTLHRDNRLYAHLSRCALVYGCRAAQNFYLERWEAPLPTARTCNARCVGCLSLQPEGACPASHDRIAFTPTAEEVADVAVPHFERVAEAVASFGQGCEGEPLLNPTLLEAAVRLVRARTDRGTLNLNTNASRPRDVAALCAAGLDSLRISIASCRPALFDAYHRPVNYTLADVRESGKAVTGAGRYLAMNLLVFPGVTDTEPELEATARFVADTGCRLIQMRNLNVDPEPYLQLAEAASLGPPMGLIAFMRRLREAFPRLRFGYFNPPKERFASCGT